MNYFFDFDDTLVLGPNTWAFEIILPQLIQEYSLPYEKALFDKVMLTAQKRGSEDASETELLTYVFDELRWPDHLKQQLVEQVFYGYTPELFPDTVPCLERLCTSADHLYILSNNNHAEEIAQRMDISKFFHAIYTPRRCESARLKPYPDMWAFVCKDQGFYEAEMQDVMIGDDPWADGLFANRNGLSCWIIDRLARYTSLYNAMAYRWITSLAELHIVK